MFVCTEATETKGRKVNPDNNSQQLKNELDLIFDTLLKLQHRVTFHLSLDTPVEGKRCGQ